MSNSPANPPIEIWHNPRCSKSRATLALLEERGLHPLVVRYLDTPPTVDRLRQVLRALDLPPRDLVRTSEAAWKALSIDPSDDEAVLEAMHTNPVLVQRPIVINGAKAAIGRPPEDVLEIL